MKREVIDDILSEGTTRAKITLYYNNVAISNAGHDINKSMGSLTNEEINHIIESIKESKDIRFYNDLKLYYKGYLIFRKTPIILLLQLDNLKNKIQLHLLSLIWGGYHEDFINKVIDKTEDIDKKTAIEKIIKEIAATDPTTKYFKENNKIQLNLIDDIKKKLNQNIKEFNQEAKNQKETLTLFNLFFKKNLPLPFLIEEQKEQIKRSKNIILETIKLLEQTEYEKTILSWENIEVKILNSDLEDLKNAGR